jgi:hypothetical protein
MSTGDFADDLVQNPGQMADFINDPFGTVAQAASSVSNASDSIIHPDPYAPPDPPQYEVEVGPADIIDPDAGTVGQQAQGVGADGPWATSDYGGSAANDAAGTGAEGVYDDGTQGPNWTADPNAGTDGPATLDYGPGATGQLAGAEGEVTPVDDFGIF